MASRNRRRPRVVWLPVSPQFRIGANPAASPTDSGLFTSSLAVGGTGTGGTFAVAYPVVIDTPAQFLTGSPGSLADNEQSGYRLRRIVGKFFLGLDTLDSGPSQVAVTAGFIVLRVSPDGNPVNGSILGNNDAIAYAPGTIENFSDPWIWRRSWLLQNANAEPALALPNFPSTNVAYGSIADGPHIDQKTARVISSEERLIFVISATTVIDGNDQAQGFVQFVGDFRVLASMRTNAGNRRNASR